MHRLLADTQAVASGERAWPARSLAERCGRPKLHLAISTVARSACERPAAKPCDGEGPDVTQLVTELLVHAGRPCHSWRRTVRHRLWVHCPTNELFVRVTSWRSASGLQIAFPKRWRVKAGFAGIAPPLKCCGRLGPDHLCAQNPYRSPEGRELNLYGQASIFNDCVDPTPVNYCRER